MTGKIFNIQRFSIHDGPGIRTTVFMKGCNLRCLWCHNPESQEKESQLMYYKDKCVLCGACKKICGRQGTDKCTACGECVKVCRHSALKICGEDMDAESVISVVKKDMDFYKTSGGGVTFSGGEPLLQPDFLREMLGLSKKEKINTAIETAGNVPWSSFEKILDNTDYIMYDIKCIDEKKHKEGTGVSNRLILENAEKLKKTGKNILFRMPLVPGYNDGEIEKTVDFVKDYKLELMPYHTIGIYKYGALNRTYHGEKFKEPDKEYLRKITQKYTNVFCSG